MHRNKSTDQNGKREKLYKQQHLRVSVAFRTFITEKERYSQATPFLTQIETAANQANIH